MKHCSFTLLLTVFVSVAVAQPVINNMQNYIIGDKYEVHLCDSITPSAYSAKGANATWNLSVNINSSISLSVVDKSVTPLAAHFPDADFGIQYDGSGNVEYYKNSTNDVKYIGSGVSTVADIFSKGYRVAKLPITYNDSFSDTAVYDLPGAGRSGIAYTKTTADAYGTLTVDNKSFANVLRTTFERTNYDTSATEPPATQTRRQERTKTCWWDEANKTAILCITWTHTYYPAYGTFSSRVTYLKDPTPQNISNTKGQNIDISVHTQNGHLHLNGELETGKTYQLQLYNSTGQQLLSQDFTAKNQKFSCPVPDMPTGVYFISLQSRGEAPGYIKFFHQ